MQQLTTDWKVRGSNRSMDKIISFLLNRSHRMWGPPSLPLNGYRGYFLEIKRPRRELDHSHLAPSFYSMGTAANNVRSSDLPVLHACSDIVSYLKYGQPFHMCSSHAVCRIYALMPQYVHSFQFLSHIIRI